MGELTVKREIGIITAEIITIRENTNRMVLENSIEIGRRLLEAKEVVGHGGWGDYLREKVDFSTSTANNLMKLYQEYGDTQLELGKAPKSQTFRILTYSQAVALLALPEADREEVVSEHDMENTSVRELRAIIEEKKREAEAAKAEIEEAKREAEEALKQSERAWAEAAENQKIAAKREKEAKKREEELEAAWQEIKKLEDRPVEVAVQPPSQEELEAIRRDAEEGIAKKFEEELAAIRGELEQARQDGEAQSLRAEKMEKQLAIAGDKETVEFNLLFQQVQDVMERLHQKRLAIQARDPEKAKKVSLAVGKMLLMLLKKWEG